jgi:hypothetical protein
VLPAFDHATRVILRTRPRLLSATRHRQTAK